MNDSDEIRSAYDGYGETGRERLWDLRNRGFARLIRDRDAALVDLVQRGHPAGGRLLDVGSGEGALARSLADAGVVVSFAGVDLLPEPIERARRSIPGEFLVAGADHLPFADGSFDTVAAVTLFSSLPTERLEQAVADEIRRVLRPGGWLVWFDLRYDNPSNRHVHGLDARRITRLFPGWLTEIRSICLAPPIARRLGPLTPVAYPLLHAIPLLRSHLVGRLQCPP